MCCYEKILAKFRRLSTPELLGVVSAKFAFGFGLAAALAGPRKSAWRTAGCVIMLLTTLLSLPLAARVLTEKDE